MEKKPRTNVNSLPALLFWTLVWQAAAMAMGNPLLLPAPLQVLQRLWLFMPASVQVAGVPPETVSRWDAAVP